MGEMSAKRNPRNPTERHGTPKYGLTPLVYTHFSPMWLLAQEFFLRRLGVFAEKRAASDLPASCVMRYFVFPCGSGDFDAQ